MIDPIHTWEDDGGMVYTPDYEARYLVDSALSERIGLSPSEPIDPDKVGVISPASVGVQVSCNGFMGNPELSQFHYADSLADGIAWLHTHGCGKIVNLIGNQVL